MSTLNDMWRDYRDKVYPKEISAEQNRDCHQAFIAGALVALQAVLAISECPDTDADENAAAAKIGALIEEARGWAKMRSVALNQPRN